MKRVRVVLVKEVKVRLGSIGQKKIVSIYYFYQIFVACLHAFFSIVARRAQTWRCFLQVDVRRSADIEL